MPNCWRNPIPSDLYAVPHPRNPVCSELARAPALWEGMCQTPLHPTAWLLLPLPTEPTCNHSCQFWTSHNMSAGVPGRHKVHALGWIPSIKSVQIVHTIVATTNTGIYWKNFISILIKPTGRINVIQITNVTTIKPLFSDFVVITVAMPTICLHYLSLAFTHKNKVVPLTKNVEDGCWHFLRMICDL